jgi:hypothetical protein
VNLQTQAAQYTGPIWSDNPRVIEPQKTDRRIRIADERSRIHAGREAEKLISNVPPATNKR